MREKRCKRCKNDYSWHEWRQSPYCSPYCKSIADGTYRDADDVSGAWSRHQKQEIKTFEKDILQPLNKDGTFSKKFIDTHGTKTIEKETGLSEREIRAEAERYS
jgi:endogenous inhibitor of DNA gyrase (YacG/DUF329 family)